MRGRTRPDRRRIAAGRGPFSTLARARGNGAPGRPTRPGGGSFRPGARTASRPRGTLREDPVPAEGRTGAGAERTERGGRGAVGVGPPVGQAAQGPAARGPTRR